MRREYGSATPTTIATITDSSVRSYTDTTVVKGVLYEYLVTQMFVDTSTGATWAFPPSSWVSSGVEVPLNDSPGRVLLLVDETVAAGLESRIDLFERRLIGAGWRTSRSNVPRDTNAPGTSGSSARTSDPRPTKQVITSTLAEHTDLKAVILIGRVTIPFSGSNDPDGHGTRAHSTDAFYADTNEAWQDTINHSSTLSPLNIPGDLRWDVRELANGRELMVGRIDFAGLPLFAQSESQLLDRYFHKNHAFRTGALQASRQGFWTTNAPYLDVTTANMWSYFGGNSVVSRGSTSWRSITDTESYLWAAAGAGGSVSSTTGISTTEMAASDYKVVFATAGASYMMETWKNNSAIRALIAMPTWGLASVVSHGLYGEVTHPGFSMGRPLGELNLGPVTRFPRFFPRSSTSFQFTQKSIHADLHGDPTLGMYVTLPPSRLEVVQSGDSAQLTWLPTSAPNFLGYHVYRGDGWDAPFNRLTSQPVAATTFTDVTPRSGDVIYMVRAVALETRGTGTYHAASQGIFAPLSLAGQSNLPPTATLTTFTVPEDGSVVVALAGQDPEGDVLTPVIIRPPQHGTLVLDNGSNFRYTPRSGFSRTDSFAYVVNDGYQDSPAVEVQIPVTPDARPPRAAFWTLEERPVGQSASTAANAILDLHPDGHNLHLTASQAFSVAAGAPEFGGGRALDFQNNGNLSLSDAASGNAFDYGATQSFTIEAVFRVAEGYTTTAGLVGKDNGTALSSWYVRLDSRRIRFQVGDHATSAHAMTTALITNNNWRHVAAIRDATNPANKRLKIYLDGQLITDAADTTQHSLTNGNALTVGTLFNNSSRLTGFIDMVRITPRVLDPAEFLGPFTQFDADGDGISDTYERTAFGNLAMVDSGDRDGDGSNDLLEFALGTDPTSASSAPALHLDPRSTELEITHRQRELPSWLSLALQSSTDLVRWDPLASTQSQSTLGAGLLETTHIAVFPDGIPDRIFLRLVLHRQ